jgi:hypothetical protein
MQISFLRLGVKDYPNRVGFACEVDGKLLAFSDVNKALAHVDYKQCDITSIFVHHMQFDPTVYTFTVDSDESMLEILKEKLSKDSAIAFVALRSISGHAKIIAFPDGIDPFTEAVKISKTLI